MQQLNHNQAEYVRITQLLLRTGLRPSWNGFHYLSEAIALRMRPDFCYAKLSVLCSTIGSACEKSEMQINGSMRRAITKAYDATKDDANAIPFWHYFHGYCPTVLEYISFAAEVIFCDLDMIPERQRNTAAKYEKQKPAH